MMQLPLVFMSWGFRSYGDKFRTPEELALYCNVNGIRTVACQLGYTPDGEQNVTADEAERLRDAGLSVVVWGVADPAFAAGELQRLGATVAEWLPQIESPGQRDLVLDAARQGLKASAIVTTYSGAGAESKADVDRLREVGVRFVLVECYAEGGYPFTDLNRMLWQGTQYGWPADELYACLGTYRSEMPDAYTHTEQIGRDFGLYLAEPMSGEQWAAFGDLNANAPPEPPDPEPEEDMDPITDQQARDSVKTVTQAAMSAYTDPKPKGRNTINWRIANAEDPQWNAARDGVKAALDKAGVPDVPS